MRPAAGVECRRCREEKQHRCQAQIFDDGVPLCLPCADEAPCVIDRVGAPKIEATEALGFEAGIYAADIEPAPVIHRTPEELGLSRIVPAESAAPLLTDEEFAKKKREAFELANAVRRRGRAKAEPNFSVRMYHARKRHVEQARVIDGETVVMSAKAVMGPEMLAPAARQRYVGSKPGRKLRFSSAEIERRRMQMMTMNVGKGAATRAVAWAEDQLGKVPDREVAAELGVTPSRVAQLREEKGIAPAVASNSHPGERRTEEVMDEMREAVKKLGGTMTDEALGEQLGVSGSRVGQLRKELGIPAMKPGRKPAAASTTKALIKTGQRPVVIPENGTIDALLDSEGIEVRLRLTPAQARAQLAKLTAPQMSIALGAVLQASLREG